MTRRFTATLMGLGLAALLAFDLTTTPPNPYKAPAAVAFGSGQASAGGFCGALPN
ncbi:hypothetical protein [Gemmobacter lutimaris]|uniref:hypothetical protein n=1 Tax=Gemmobacter lutimaris TaxID=2306023 RepID=UPI0018F62475|nr:hypothetical protein [Gemmobacter lutimaris]